MKRSKRPRMPRRRRILICGMVYEISPVQVGIKELVSMNKWIERAIKWRMYVGEPK